MVDYIRRCCRFCCQAMGTIVRLLYKISCHMAVVMEDRSCWTLSIQP